MPAPGYESVIPYPKHKLLEQIREVMRLKHCSIRTERTYLRVGETICAFPWDEVAGANAAGRAQDGSVFLNDLAVNNKVAAATQNRYTDGERRVT